MLSTEFYKKVDNDDDVSNIIGAKVNVPQIQHLLMIKCP